MPFHLGLFSKAGLSVGSTDLSAFNVRCLISMGVDSLLRLNMLLRNDPVPWRLDQ
jgi:hypothetical protein